MAHFGWLTYQTDDFPNYVFQRHFHHFHQDLGQILWYWWWNIMEYSSKTVGEILLQKSWEGKVQQKRQVNVMDDVFLGVICFVGPLGPLGPHGGFGRRIQVKFGEMVKWIFSDRNHQTNDGWWWHTQTRYQEWLEFRSWHFFQMTWFVHIPMPGDILMLVEHPSSLWFHLHDATVLMLFKALIQAHTKRWFIIHWIGLRENFNRKAPYLMVKTMVSCRFSLKPIQWIMGPQDKQIRCHMKQGFCDRIWKPRFMGDEHLAIHQLVTSYRVA